MGKSETRTRRRFPRRTPFASAILELTHQFLLLGIDGDRRFSRGQEGLCLGIDMLERRIAIGVVSSLTRLAIDLQAVAPFVEQLADQLMGDLMALMAQFRG